MTDPREAHTTPLPRNVRRDVACAAIMLGALTMNSLTLAQEARVSESDRREDEAALEATTFGLGLQTSWPSFGLSAMMDLNEEVSVQGILGLFGTINMFGAKGLYRFSIEELWNLYAYGAVGAVSFKYLSERETTLGLGTGAGLEYDWRAWQRNLPPIRWNIELGLAYADFDYYDYTGLTFGGGLHYRF